MDLARENGNGNDFGGGYNIKDHCTFHKCARFLEYSKGMEGTPEAVDIEEKKRIKKELAEQKRAQK